MTSLFCYTCIILWILIKDTYAVCTLPGNLQNSVWVDSDKGDTTFNTTHVIGLGVRIGPVLLSVDEWECFHNGSGTTSNLILKATVTYQFSVETYRPFLCLRLVAITDYSYYYYIHAPGQPTALNERVNVLLESSVAAIADPDVDVCQFTPVDTADSEYHVLVKKGNENDTIQTCPSAYFGKYSYNVTDISTGATSCGTGSEQWDVCADRQRMTFNYTLCTTPIAFSASGSVFCVASLTSGSYVLHTVYNEDATVDNSNTYRFTCFMSSLNADGSITASMTPKSCTKTQTPSTQPTLTNGTVVGLNVALNPIVLCPITTTTTTTTPGPDTDSSETSVGPIVGGTVGGIVFIALLILLLCLCLRFRLCMKICKRKDNKDDEVNKSKNENKTYASNKVKIMEDDIKEHESYRTYDGKNGGLNTGVTMFSTSEEKHIHTEREYATMKKELPCAIDIEYLPHIRHPHWIHGPRGEPPKGTAYQRNIKIGQSNGDMGIVRTDTSLSFKHDNILEATETEIQEVHTLSKLEDVNVLPDSTVMLVKNKTVDSELNSSYKSKSGVAVGTSKVPSEYNNRDNTDISYDDYGSQVSRPQTINTPTNIKYDGDHSPLLCDSPDNPFAADRLETVLNLAEFIDRGVTPEPSTNRTTSRISIRSTRALSIHRVDASISSFLEVKSETSDTDYLDKNMTASKSPTEILSIKELNDGSMPSNEKRTPKEDQPKTSIPKAFENNDLPNKVENHETFKSNKFNQNLLNNEMANQPNLNLKKPIKNVQFKNNVIEGENNFHGNALQILQKSASSLSLRNKTGIFIFELEKERTQESMRDNLSEKGIAYDDDCQYEMEKGYTGIEKETQEEVDWTYGVRPHTGESIDPSERGSNEKQIENDSDQTEDSGEDEASETSEEDVVECFKTKDNILEFSGKLDDDRAETAMSIFYTNNGNDPDQMVVSFDGSLTPIVE